MIVAIISTSVIALGLFFILLSQQKRIAALSANEARLEAKDAQLDGKDALLAQSEALLAQKDVRIEQVEGQLRAAEIQLEKHRDAFPIGFRQHATALQPVRYAHLSVPTKLRSAPKGHPSHPIAHPWPQDGPHWPTKLQSFFVVKAI